MVGKLVRWHKGLDLSPTLLSLLDVCVLLTAPDPSHGLYWAAVDFCRLGFDGLIPCELLQIPQIF